MEVFDARAVDFEEAKAGAVEELRHTCTCAASAGVRRWAPERAERRRAASPGLGGEGGGGGGGGGGVGGGGRGQGGRGRGERRGPGPPGRPPRSAREALPKDIGTMRSAGARRPGRWEERTKRAGAPRG